MSRQFLHGAALPPGRYTYVYNTYSRSRDAKPPLRGHLSVASAGRLAHHRRLPLRATVVMDPQPRGKSVADPLRRDNSSHRHTLSWRHARTHVQSQGALDACHARRAARRCLSRRTERVGSVHSGRSDAEATGHVIDRRHSSHGWSSSSAHGLRALGTCNIGIHGTAQRPQVIDDDARCGLCKCGPHSVCCVCIALRGVGVGAVDSASVVGGYNHIKASRQ